MQELLKNTKIIDLTRALAGPYCTALLADLGADVVKVEPGPKGDGARAWPPFDANQESLYFAPINRNKRSLSLLLRTAEGMEILHSLLATADVLIENFRPGTLAKMGLAPEELRRRYPRLIIASISGLGHVGPEKGSAGLDQIAQGMSGLMSVTGSSTDEPQRVGIPIIDTVTGIVAATGIAAALAGRARTGRGTYIQTSLLESALSIMNFQAQRFLSNGEVPKPTGNDHPTITPYGLFATADEPINIAVGDDTQFRKLTEILGDPTLPDQEEYREPTVRLSHREQLRADIEGLLSSRGSTYWIQRIREAGIPCGPIHTMDRVFDDPQVRALQMVQTAPGEGDDMPILRGPLWVEGQPSKVKSNPPRLGQDSHAVLIEAGLTDEDINRLIEDGVVIDSAGKNQVVGYA